MAKAKANGHIRICRDPQNAPEDVEIYEEGDEFEVSDEELSDYIMTGAATRIEE